MQGNVHNEDQAAAGPKPLPLRAFHEALGAKFTAFAGWEMPVAYGSSLEEHLACRRAAAAFDVSHMGELEVTGSEAGRFLDYALTNLVSSVAPGQAVYSALCAEDGGTLDDLIVYKRGEEDYFLCVNASNAEADFAHLAALAEGFSCVLKNLSASYGQLAVQGPAAEAIVAQVVGTDIASMQKMTFREPEVFGEQALLARSDYTGEDGFEVYSSLGVVERWAEALGAGGEPLGLKWAGLAARDGLRLEAGFPLHGHELSASITPLQAGLGWAVDWDKSGGFVGRDALLREREAGPPGRLAHYVAEGRRIPRDGAVVSLGGEEVGRVTSGGYSPLLEKPIGTAWLRLDAWLKRAEEGWKAKVRGSGVPLRFGKPALRL